MKKTRHLHLIRAIAKYDPTYTEKVKKVVEVMDEELPDEPLWVFEVNRHVDFDCHRYLRLLCRRGYLTRPASRQKQGLPREKENLKTFTPI